MKRNSKTGHRLTPHPQVINIAQLTNRHTQKVEKPLPPVFGSGAGFTLIELLVVIAIVVLLAAVVLVSLNRARQESRVAAALTNQQSLRKAVELYVSDMGFYLPDVNRGWDPGLAKPLPYNSDTGQDCNTNPADCPTCSHCCPSWETTVQSNWRGPYIADWPRLTPWNGKYDYQYWDVDTTRYGC